MRTPLAPASVLPPEVVTAVGSLVPVLATEGYYDGRGLAAALALGADGTAMATRTMITQKCEPHNELIVVHRVAA